MRSTFMPWHRRPLDGEDGVSFQDMMAGLQSTSHLLDVDPEPHDHVH
jgi:hypothetical protein